MHRLVLVAACIGLGAVLAAIENSKARAAATAIEPRASTELRVPAEEAAYAGWTREELVAELERHENAVGVRKNALLDKLVAQGNFEEHFEPSGAAEAPAALASRPDAVAVRVDATPSHGGRIVRTTHVLRGYDVELDRLVDEIERLKTRLAASLGE